MEKIKVKIVSTEIIKPSSPTPLHLKTLTLSLLDILSSPMYTGSLLFYTPNPQNSLQETSFKLKKSLSQTLSIFYPLAGRVNGSFVDCNDEGAVFIETRVNHQNLSQFLHSPVSESLQSLVPVDSKSTKAVSWPVLIIQANFFTCGGLVISICTCHRLTDAASLAMFITEWAKLAKDFKNIPLIPSFNASNLFPIPPEFPLKPVNKLDSEKLNSVTKRFVFDSLKIRKLKAIATSNLVKNPTRVEVVTALFWRCAIKASRLSSSTPKDSAMQIPVSLRGKVDSLPENTIGNLLSILILEKKHTKIQQIQEIVGELRAAKEVFSFNCKEMLTGDSTKASLTVLEGLKEMGKVYSRANEVDLWMSNSWCKLPMYEADFGWGKPVWVTGRGTSSFNNLMLLIDAKDGEGIEAWVTLTEQHMFLFENDQELLEYCFLNPPVLI